MKAMRRATAPTAFVTLLAFWSAAIAPRSARAQDGPERELVPAPSSVPRSEEASYDREAIEALGAELEASAAAAPTEGGKLDEPQDVDRALAALPSGGGTVSPQATALPSGAATQLGMGESFGTQLSTGGVTYTVPLALPSARGLTQPRLGLAYNSSGGFGVAGVGWGIGAPAISRQTDRGLPGYDDQPQWHAAQDRFSFGATELVPICTVSAGSCAGKQFGESMPVWANGWQYFRARTEGAFLRFFWSPDHLTWRVQGKDSSNLEFGVPLDSTGYAGALERDPGRPSRVFRWFLARQYDSQGGANDLAGPTPINTVVYRYLEDGGSLYLSDLYDTSPAANPTTTDLSQYAHHTRLVYQARPDVATSYRAGWLTRHALRLTRVDVSSKTFTGTASSAREMVRRYHLAYEAGLHRSLLASVQLEGRCSSAIAEDGTQTLPLSSCPRVPAVRFGYQRVQGGDVLRDSQGFAFAPFAETVQTLASSPPRSLDEAATELADINADGLPDVLVTAGGLYDGRHGIYWNGLDENGARGFGTLDTMAVEAAGDAIDANVLEFGNPNVAALDLDSDGIINLVHMPRAKTYSVFHPQETAPGSRRYFWRGRQVVTASQQDLKIDFTGDAQNVRVLDVNADGLVDVVYSSPTELQTFYALGRHPGGEDQFGQATPITATEAAISNEPVRRCAPWSSTVVRFSDPETQIADMNGDGLADIARVRSGQVLYWPGRGNGFFGTGDADDCQSGFADSRHVEMLSPPQFGTARPGALQLGDINGDGLADLVEVRAQGVDIYLNDNGLGFTERHIIDDTPFLPAASNYARITDINGSGTPDILWGAAYDYRYIDLTGGVTPDLLVHIENGLGKTMELEYEPSTEQMLRAEDEGAPWTMRAPSVLPVLRRSVVRDHLELINRPAGVYSAIYTYRDPYYEGRQRELRGFREATVTSVGDGNSPTGYARSVFLLGECPEQACGDANWREALKGLPVLSEAFDGNGIYVATEHSRYTLRQLYTGLDLRRVVVALPTGKQGFGYDTASFDRNESSVTVDDVLHELDGFPPNSKEQRDVTLRASTGTAQVSSTTVFDNFGNVTEHARHGCTSGCPNGPDETIYTTSTFHRPTGDESGWLWREQTSWVHGTVHGAPRSFTRHVYDSRGHVLQSFATLSGTLALSRSALGTTTAPNQSGGSGAPVEIPLSTNTYDAFGHATFARAPNSRCGSSEYDPVYAHLPTLARAYAGTLDATSNCGSRVFAHSVSYDRGLGVVTSSRTLNDAGLTLDPQQFYYDGFGRFVATRRAHPAIAPRVCGADLSSCGVMAQQMSSIIEYTLPADGRVTPYTMTRVRVLDSADPDIEQYTDGYSFADGLGRTIVSLSQADPDPLRDNADWVATGAVAFDAKGAAARKYDPIFHRGTPQSFIALPPVTTSAFSSQQFDAFGRSTWTYDAGEVQGRAVYHALSADAWDAEDLKAGGDHQNTPMTLVNDGHGRTVQEIARIDDTGTLEEHRTLIAYLPTGEAHHITRRRAGSPDVVRWMRFDTLGRMVLNVEPNTTTGFTTDWSTATPPAAIRYAYNDAGNMVGYSDARGCGANYHYDAGGRLLAEDRSPCLSTQAAYTAPNLSTGDGTEVFYRYDVPDPEGAAIVDAGGNTLPITAASLWGRVASVSSMGSKGVLRYDALGRNDGGGLRLLRGGAPSAVLTTRYAPRWYVTTTAYDAADRPRSARTGMTVPQLLGSDGRSELTYSYTKRGRVDQIGSSYGVLFRSAKHRADGLVESFTLGDAAATQRHFSYDVHRRVESVQTYRGNLPLWSAAPQGLYTPPSAADDPTLQLLLEDFQLDYDDVGNPLIIEDHRLPAEWPNAAKPVSRSFRYDDLYRLTRTQYAYAGGNSWVSPFAAEHADATRVQPSPLVSFSARVTEQQWTYDHLGNLSRTTDDQNAFWDRSSGDRSHGTATSGPDRVLSASNRALAPASPRKGDLSVDYDASGNVTGLVVRRDGACLPAAASCWQRFVYEWDEIGQLSRARRWDLRTTPTNERSLNDGFAEPVPARSADVELRFDYDGSGSRVRKTATDPAGAQRHTVYITGSYELRSTTWNGSDYVLDATTASLRLPAGPVAARVLYVAQNLPSQSSAHRHLFLELSDYLGSGAIVVDHETGELVELTTYQSYGATESDYRPGRWGSFRESYKFTGKEEDIEVGLQYFGARYYSPYLGVWMSPDPVTIHEAGGGLNPYAYVGGRPTAAVDPDGRILQFILIAAAVSMGANLISQIAAGGTIQILGANGVLAAGALGALGAATGIGLAPVLGTIGAGMAAGAIGYGAGAGIGAYEPSWSGFIASTVGAGMSAGVARHLGPGLWNGVKAAVAGTVTSLGISALGGQQLSVKDVALSVGLSAAGAMAAYRPTPKQAPGQQSQQGQQSTDGEGAPPQKAADAANDAESAPAQQAGKIAQQSSQDPDPAPAQQQAQSPAPAPQQSLEKAKPDAQPGPGKAPSKKQGTSIHETTPDAPFDFNPPRLRIGCPGIACVPITPSGEVAKGPFTHQINKGGLDIIVNTGKFKASPASMIAGGASAVRATSGALRPDVKNDVPVIEFYTTDPPDNFHPRNHEVFWYRDDGATIDVFVTKIRMPDGTVYLFDPL